MLYQDEIIRFCELRNNTGALLITGKWGSGKTYYINNILCNDEQIKNRYNILQVSLFGYTSIEQIRNELIKQYLFLRLEVDKKIDKSKFSLAFKMISDTIKNNEKLKVFASFDAFQLIRIEKIGSKPYLLIFDDFERSPIDLVSLLGLINEYSEQDCFSVIVVANEEMISSNFDASDMDNYNHMKEKVFYRTIGFLQIDQDIVYKFIEDYVTQNKAYMAFILDTRELLLNLYDNSGYRNLRSLQIVLQDYERIFEILNNKPELRSYIKEIYSAFVALVFEVRNDPGEFKYCIPFCISRDNHTSAIIDRQKKEEELVNKYKLCNKEYFFDSILHWLLYGVWRKQDFLKEINQVVESTKKLSPEESLLLDGGILYNDDDSFKVGFIGVTQKAYKGQLSISGYMNFLILIDESYAYDIELPCEIDYALVKLGLGMRIENLRSGIYDEDVRRVNPNKIVSFRSTNSLVNEILLSIEEYIQDKVYFDNKVNLIKAIKHNNFEMVSSILEKSWLNYDNDIAREIIIFYLKLENVDKKQLSTLIIYSLRGAANNLSKKKVEEASKIMIELLEREPYCRSISCALNKLLIRDLKNSFLQNFGSY